MQPKNPHFGIHDLLVSYQHRHPSETKPKGNEADTIRVIAGRILNALDEYTQITNPADQENTVFWNGKETPLSVLVKLTQVLSRLPDIQCGDASEEINPIPENDMERLEAYARRLLSVGEKSPCKPAEE